MTELPEGFYTDTERDDAVLMHELIDDAEEGALPQAVRDKLQEIAVRAPKGEGAYEARRQVGDVLYIKAWPGEEPWYKYAYEENHLDPTVTRVVCVDAVYPVAWLLLARELDSSGDDDQALEFAEVSMSLEEHPASLCELGAMVGVKGESKIAMELFKQAFELRDDVAPWLRSRAALGVGVTLLEAGELEQAEDAIKVALQYEPDSEVAKHALRFVEETRGESAGDDGASVDASDQDDDEVSDE